MNIHRSKKLNGIAKKKDDICKHLESGNEMNAKIWVSQSKTNENVTAVIIMFTLKEKHLVLLA